MVETVTAHYGWTKPELTKSASTWGGFLNTDLDSIDALVFANQQGVVPVGAITMFAGATAPTNWLICDGRSLDTTAYAALFAVLQYAHGGSGANFNLPNMKSNFPLGANPSTQVGQTGGSFSVPIAVGNLPAHAHPIVDVAHSHSITDHVHSHAITDLSHSHVVNAVFGGGSEIQSGSGWGQHNVSSGGQVTGITGTGGAATGITGTNASGTGLSTTQNVGSGTPLSVVPQYVVLNFIIRAA